MRQSGNEVVWSVFLYGPETQTMKANMIQRIAVFEMCIWKKMEKISWTERKTNGEVLSMVGKKKHLL